MQLARILSPTLHACLYCQVLSSATHMDAIITSFSVLTGDCPFVLKKDKAAEIEFSSF